MASGAVRYHFSAGFPGVVRCCPPAQSPSDKLRLNHPIRNPTRRFSVSTELQAPEEITRTKGTSSFPENGSLRNGDAEEAGKRELRGDEKNPYNILNLDRAELVNDKKRLRDYFEEAKVIIRSGGGPPRWFSPLECGSRLDNSPLLLYLPGIDGVGLDLLGNTILSERYLIYGVCIFLWRTGRHLELVERTIRSESFRSPNRPIYLVGESLGACLAIAVAAANPDIDLQLILANPATSFKKSQLPTILPLLDVVPVQYQLSLPYIMRLMTGDPLWMAMHNAIKGVTLQQTVERLSQDAVELPSYLHVLGDMLPRETLLWKLNMFRSASSFANSRLHAVKAQTLILSSAKDQLLPSEEEGERLRRTLKKCDNRSFSESGHFLFLEDGIDLVTVIKGTCFYRRGKQRHYVSDYIPPTPCEFKDIYEQYRLIILATSPVMLSTLEDGKVMKGVAGIPSEGPVLFVGYHMLLGLELGPMVTEILMKRNILLRGIAHPLMFVRLKDGLLPPLSNFDTIRMMGAVPVSGTNLFKLLSSKAHVLLYPGGLREACHRKGEEYKLCWPEQPEFIRMVASFGAKIVPFGIVGEDDLAEVVFDYEDQMKIPYFRDLIKAMGEETEKVRGGINNEVNQDIHCPVFIPKVPGRFYLYFGKPIETKGRSEELKDKEKARELYLQVKSEVEKCIAFLKEKRESDPYRSLLARLSYRATHGFSSEIPSFEL